MTPYWLRIAEDELRAGVVEILGPEHNERIVEYHKTTTLDASTDEVPWCSSFVNWVMHQAMITRTASARARTWLGWGINLGAWPAYGCVCILQRGSGKQPGPSVLDAPGHVGFYIGPGSGSEILLLGGNQSNSINVNRYPQSRLLGYRWPHSLMVHRG